MPHRDHRPGAVRQPDRLGKLSSQPPWQQESRQSQVRPIAEQQVSGNRARRPQQHRGRPVLLHVEDLPGHGNGSAEGHRSHRVQRDAEGANRSSVKGRRGGIRPPPTPTAPCVVRARVRPMRAHEEQDPGRQHDAAERHGHRHRPARPPPRSCSNSNCRMRSACWRSRMCASTQRSRDCSSSISHRLTVVCAGELPIAGGDKSIIYKNKLGGLVGGSYITCCPLYKSCAHVVYQTRRWGQA